MIKLQEAINIVMQNAITLDTEIVSFVDAYNRILAENVYSDIDIPPFNKSAMDGYALQKKDIDKPLKPVQIVQAGDMPIPTLHDGECVKIMTGARLPNNADYVAKIEDCISDENNNIIVKKIENKSNIRYKAEDLKKGELLLKAGTLIREQEIASLATVGKTQVKVYKQPHISIVSTGNELVEPHEKLTEYQIRNSNAYQLITQCKKIGISAVYHGILKDESEIIINQIEKIIDKSDILISTGGVSMGDFDLLPSSLKQLGFNIIFHTIAVQPGKPTLFAKKNNKFIFSLPGNPVSSFVHFETLIKPFVYKMMGYNYIPLTIYAPISSTYKRKKSERDSIIPVYYDNQKVHIIEYHGSAHLFALNNSNGFILVEAGTTEIKENTYVTVRLF